MRRARFLLLVVVLAHPGAPDAADRGPADTPRAGPDRRFEVLLGDGRLAWVEATAVDAPAMIEAEALLSRAIAREAPAPSRQAMHAFAGAWDGDAQLFWPAAAPRQLAGTVYASLELPIAVAEAGRYDLTLNYTVAPDYGVYNVILAGELRARIDGYAVAVGRRSMRLRDVRLRAGDNQLVLAVTGRNDAARNHFVGLDSIELGQRGVHTRPGPAPVIAAPVQVGGQTASWDPGPIHGAGQVAGIGPGECLTQVDFTLHNPANATSRPADVLARIDAPLSPAARRPVLDAGWHTDQLPTQAHWRGTLALEPLAAGQSTIRTLPVPLQANRTIRLRLSVLQGTSAVGIRLQPTSDCSGD